MSFRAARPGPHSCPRVCPTAGPVDFRAEEFCTLVREPAERECRARCGHWTPGRSVSLTPPGVLCLVRVLLVIASYRHLKVRKIDD